MTTETLRAGLVGLGMMGRNHARVLGSLDGVELVAAADELVTELPGVPMVVPTVHDLIAAGIDICVVAAPTEAHLDLGLALADAGVVTLIEKPLGFDISECDKLVAAFAASGTEACVGQIERFNPALIALRTRLLAGELGDIFQIATRRQGPFPNRIRDVGVIKDLATHDVDLTAFVADSQYVSVGAHTAHKTGREHEDLLAATGMLADGTVTNHLVNWLSPLKERVTVVTGERGCFIADTLTADLTFCANGEVTTQWDAISNFRGVTEGDVVRYAIPKPEPLRSELEALRDLALGLPNNAVPLSAGRAAVAVAEAMIESAAAGNTVDVAAAQI